MTTNPYDSPHELGDAPEKKPVRWMPTLVEVLLAGCVIVILVALLIPAKRGARESGRANTCRNNLRNIALALLQYEEALGALPPAYTVDADGKPLHSWRTLILPYMDHRSLYDKIDLTKPWDDPVNKAAYDTPIEIFGCPSAPYPPTHTTYFALVGEDRCLHPTQARKLAEITDDPGSTLMLVEGHASQDVHWMSPMDAVEPTILQGDTPRQSPHAAGANVVAVDGHVFVLSAETPAKKLRALVSIRGNDDAMARADDESH